MGVPPPGRPPGKPAPERVRRPQRKRTTPTPDSAFRGIAPKDGGEYRPGIFKRVGLAIIYPEVMLGVEIRRSARRTKQAKVKARIFVDLIVTDLDGDIKERLDREFGVLHKTPEGKKVVTKARKEVQHLLKRHRKRLRQDARESDSGDGYGVHPDQEKVQDRLFEVEARLSRVP